MMSLKERVKCKERESGRQREVQSDGCQVQTCRVGITSVLRAPPRSRWQGGVTDGQQRGSKGLLEFLTNTLSHTHTHMLTLMDAVSHTFYHLLFGLQVTDSSEMEFCLISRTGFVGGFLLIARSTVAVFGLGS